MISRDLAAVVRQAAGWYPVVTLTGPRQSGKTTLARQVFPDKRWLSFERLDLREAARVDPLALLDAHRGGAILDEVQHVPGLLSYLQVEVDERPEPGRFVVTGSHQLEVLEAVAQSLAGRTAMLELLPCSLEELGRFEAPPRTRWEAVFTTGYPRIHHRRIPANRWIADYVATYVQRDVRQILGVVDLERFSTFLRLAASRTSQVRNASALGADCGLTHNTARSWLSVLEASYLVVSLKAWERNLTKQVTRTPRLHFLEPGLAAHLVGIRDAEQLRNHPLRGPLFESWVVGEVVKAWRHRGVTPRLFHFRDRKGLEVDLVIERGDGLDLVEIKSGTTVAGDWATPLERLEAMILRRSDHDARPIRRVIVYGGEEPQRRGGADIVPWHQASATLGP